jgi:RmlD substrate binding domain
MSQSVLILGGQGVLGSMVADAFGQAGWTTVRASRRGGQAPGIQHVDLSSPETLENALDDVKPDVVVSAVPDASLTAERSVIRRGGVIINVATLALADIGRLRQNPGPGDGTAVMYAGIAPGLSSLLAASLLAAHPEADEVELAFTVSANGSSGPAAADGAFASMSGVARHRTASIPLPAPFGRTRCLSLGEQDNGWLGGPVADGKTVSSYFCLTPRSVRYVLLAANAAGLLGRLPRGAMPAKPPGPVATPSAEPVAHWVAVRRRGSYLAARTIRATGDYHTSAAITVLFAQALTGPAPALRAGVLFPEEIVTLDDIRPGLAEAGVTIVDEPVTR